MGYTTDFQGYLRLSKQPTAEQVAYIAAFNKTRRMKRNAERTATLADPIREAVGLPIGEDGAYYVGGDEGGNFWDKQPQTDVGIIDYNTPPGQKTWKQRQDEGDNSYIVNLTQTMQPGLWCQWVLELEHVDNEPEWVLQWDGGEKFYEYIAWLQYLITHFFNVWDIKLNGEITWQGEDSSDLGMISVVDSVVTAKEGKVVYV